MDLDGVMVDWHSATAALAGLDPKAPATIELLRTGKKIEDITGVNLVKLINSCGPAYWETLEFLPTGRVLYERLEDEFVTKGTHDIVFLTNPSRFTYSSQGKLNWRDRHYPKVPMIITRDKHYCAGPGKFLVDDGAYQIDPFNEAGGTGFLWPAQWDLQSGAVCWQATLNKLLDVIRQQEES